MNGMKILKERTSRIAVKWGVYRIRLKKKQNRGHIEITSTSKGGQSKSEKKKAQVELLAKVARRKGMLYTLSSGRHFA